jgi:hypothetical protein
MEKTLDLRMPGVTELGQQELLAVDGGFPPSSWWMDDDTIAMNGKIGDAYFSFLGGFLVGLFD